jgi:hypothetical protein
MKFWRALDMSTISFQKIRGLTASFQGPEELCVDLQ